MSYFIRLYKNVDCQRTYDNVRWFSSRQEQRGYFQNRQYKENLECTPFKGRIIRVDLNADELRSISYFSYGLNNGKELYCFMDSVEYVNEYTCDISYTIDDIQTYMFDIKFNSCFIEREHVIDDTIGANLIVEGLDKGEYIYPLKTNTPFFNPANYCTVLATTVLPSDLQNNAGKIYSNVYSGTAYIKFPRGGEEFLNEQLDVLVEGNKKDAIVGIFSIPNEFYNDTQFPVQKTFELPQRPTSIDGYIPKNNKLFTYPYCFLQVTNNNGSSIELRYEFLGSSTMTINSNMGINFECYTFPNLYKGVAFNQLYKLKINSFPMCSYNVDSYQAWLAQNQGYFKSTALNTATQTLSGLGAMAFGAYTGNPAIVGGGAIALNSAVTKATNVMIENQQAETLPAVSKNATSGIAEYSNGDLNFTSYVTTITREFAEKIDHYYSRYGYPINDVKKPNINTHSVLNFVKTVGCNFTGNIPSESLNNILSIFDNGVALWHVDFSNVSNEIVLSNEVKEK